VNFEASPATTVPVGIGSVVALGFTHDWGPSESVVSLRNLADFKSFFGPTETTAGFKAVMQAFTGEGLEGRGGAGQVLAFRMVGAAGAKATRPLSNTTPAVAITLTAKSDGSYGNNLTVTTQDTASDATKTDLILYVGGVEVERYTFADTNVADLANQINAASLWVTATQTITGVALGIVSNQSFSGGADGTTLLAADYLAAMAAFDSQRFGVLAFEDLTDVSITASLRSWSENWNANGKRFITVLGGLANELIATAVSRAVAAASENIVTVGLGSVRDETLGVLSTSQLAPRIAGIMAAKGEAQSMTYARLQGVVPVVGASAADILTAFDAGVMVLGRDSNPDAPVRIEKALTTYVAKTNAQKPYLIYRNPKYVRTMQGLQMELADWSDANIIGRNAVSDKTRQYVVGETRARCQRRVDLGVIQPGFTCVIDPNPTPSDTDEYVAVLVGLGFGRSVEQVFFTIQVA
jgi:hypothetical protein